MVRPCPYLYLKPVEIDILAAIWFVCCRLLTELSTPSVNLRFILILLKKENTFLFTINENFGYWAFVVSRPLLSPVFWYCTLTHWNNQLFWNLDPLLLAFWIITAGGLDALNIMWFKTISIGNALHFITVVIGQLRIL